MWSDQKENAIRSWCCFNFSGSNLVSCILRPRDNNAHVHFSCSWMIKNNLYKSMYEMQFLPLFVFWHWLDHTVTWRYWPWTILSSTHNAAAFRICAHFYSISRSSTEKNSKQFNRNCLPCELSKQKPKLAHIALPVKNWRNLKAILYAFPQFNMFSKYLQVNINIKLFPWYNNYITQMVIWHKFQIFTLRRISMAFKSHVSCLIFFNAKENTNSYNKQKKTKQIRILPIFVELVWSTPYKTKRNEMKAILLWNSLSLANNNYRVMLPFIIWSFFSYLYAMHRSFSSLSCILSTCVHEIEMKQYLQWNITSSSGEISCTIVTAS